MLYKDTKTHNIRDIEKYITFSLSHIVTSMITIPVGEILTMYNQMTPPMSPIHQLKEKKERKVYYLQRPNLVHETIGHNNEMCTQSSKIKIRVKEV